LPSPPSRLEERLPPWRAGLRAALCVLVVAGSHRPARGDELHETARQLVERYANQLGDLADWCDQRGLAEQAEKTRAWLHPKDPNRLYVTRLPSEMGRPALPADAPADVVEWDHRLARLQRDQANALYELAQRAIRGRRASLALDLVLAALHENPDHEACRRVLGYQSYRGGWHTVWQVRKLRNGEVWHDRFGWLPKSHVSRYENGERYDRGRWITAEEDARLRDDLHRDGWDVESEHYVVRTNHSLEAGVTLVAQLEKLYRVWKELFIRYYATQEQVAALFSGRGPSSPIRLNRHSVYYYRNRDEYHRALRSSFPGIEISVGIYVENAAGRGRGRAYFFAGEDADLRTLFHEATHQLFAESRPVSSTVGRRHNFWIVEGIALYMESLRDEDGYHVLGGFDDVRMEAARFRLIHDGFYVPFHEFTTYGMQRVQTDPRIATLYSQAAGMTHFLIHYDDGRYRDALVAYLAAVYSGRDAPDTLARLTRTPYSELDRQYREFIEQGGAVVSGG